MTKQPQIRLKPGDNALPLPGAFARLEFGAARPHKPYGDAYVTIVIDGRDAGGWQGTWESCEVWLEGFLIGRLGGKAT